MAHQLIDVGVKNGTTTVSEDRVRISIKEKEHVVWKTDQDQPFAVCFPEGGPFESPIFVGTKTKPAVLVRQGSLYQNTFVILLCCLHSYFY